MTLTGKDLEEEMDGFQRQGQIAGEKRLGRPEVGVDVSNLTQASITAAFWNAKILVAMQSPGQFRANGTGTRAHWTHASKIIPLSLPEKDWWHRQQPVGGRWWTWGIRMDSKDYELWCFRWSTQNVESWKPRQHQQQTWLPVGEKSPAGQNPSPPRHLSVGLCHWKPFPSCL